MTTLLNDVRQEVITAFTDAHQAHYPTTKVNYPNLMIVDIEHQVDPFVSVELDTSRLEQAALGENELLVPGILYIYFYFQKGTGTAHAYDYTDMLNQYLGMQHIGAIYYEAVRPISIETFPGWIGFMNVVRFQISKETVC